EVFESNMSKLEYFLFDDGVDVIPRQEFRDIVFQYGVPDNGRCRSLTWKLLLGYLPWDKTKWKQAFEDSRKNYAMFVDELYVNPYEEKQKTSSSGSTGVSI